MYQKHPELKDSGYMEKQGIICKYIENKQKKKSKGKK